MAMTSQLLYKAIWRALPLSLLLPLSPVPKQPNIMTPKRGRKAPVWTYMEKTDPETVVCLICKDTFKYSGSTSSMMKHIRSKHALEYAELREDTAAEQELELNAKVAKETSTVQPTLHDTINRA